MSDSWFTNIRLHISTVMMRDESPFLVSMRLHQQTWGRNKHESPFRALQKNQQMIISLAVS